MTRAEIKRRKRRKREIQRAIAWAIVFTVEALIAAIPAAISAAILFPMMYRVRGGFAVGGEWMLVILLFVSGFYALHNWFCNKLYGEEE